METAFLNNLPVLQSQLLSKETGIVHFCTLRGIDPDEPADSFGKYNLCSYSGDTEEHVHWSRQKYAEALGISVNRMWFPRQVHGIDILVVDSSMPDNQEADAVITKETNLLIGVSTADCVPVLLYDPTHKVIAAIHAGWRGTVAGIVSKTVTKFCEVSGGSASDILATIGPSISPEAFEVGEEVAEQFALNGFEDCIIHNYTKPHIDLWKANMKQLFQSGLKETNIDCSPMCTYNNCDILFSARKLGLRSGRIVSGIIMRSLEVD